MDAQEMIAGGAEISAVCLGNMKGEHLLVPLDQDGLPLSDATILYAKEKCLSIVGIFGFKDGQFGAKAEPGPACAFVMLKASPAFAQYVASRLLQPKTESSAAWLQKLYSLEDPRTQV